MSNSDYITTFKPVYRFKKNKDTGEEDRTKPVWYCKLRGDSTQDWRTKFRYVQKTTDENGQTRTELVEVPWLAGRGSALQWQFHF